MAEKMKVLLGDNELYWGELCREFLNKDYYCPKICDHGIGYLLQRIYVDRPHVIAAPLLMKEMQPETFISMIRHIPAYAPKIILMSEDQDEDLRERAARAGADFYFCNPFEFYALCDYLSDLDLPGEPKQPETAEQALEMAILDRLREMRITRNTRGFEYIRVAIAAIYHDPTLAAQMVSNIYPMLASSAGVHPEEVEGDIRAAVLLSWEKMDYVLLEQHFGSVQNKPNNVQYITAVAQHLPKLPKTISAPSRQKDPSVRVGRMLFAK